MKYWIIQVCLISQLWDNMGNMAKIHELITWAHMLSENLTVSWLLERTTALATFEQSENVESTARAWQRTDLVSQGSAGHSKYAELCAIHFKMHLYMATLVCAHGTAIVTNHGPSELVAERIKFFYALRKRTLTM